MSYNGDIDKEMAPRVLPHPGTRPTETEETVDEKSLAQRQSAVRVDEEQEDRNCFYCLEGWVFLGSIGHDGEEVIEPIRCRRCGGRAG